MSTSRHGFAVTCQHALFVFTVDDNAYVAQERVSNLSLRVFIQDLVEDVYAMSAASFSVDSQVTDF